MAKSCQHHKTIWCRSSSLDLTIATLITPRSGGDLSKNAHIVASVRDLRRGGGKEALEGTSVCGCFISHTSLASSHLVAAEADPVLADVPTLHTRTPGVQALRGYGGHGRQMGAPREGDHREQLLGGLKQGDKHQHSRLRHA